MASTMIPVPVAPAHTAPRFASTVLRIAAETVLLTVLMAAVVGVVWYDTAYLGNTMSERSLTEAMQSAMLLAVTLSFAFGAVRYVAARGYLVLATTFFAMLFIRENDAVLDQIVHGFWVVPALVIALVGAVLTHINRDTLTVPLVRHFEHRSATFVYIGLLVLVVFSRLFGTGALWVGVMGASYDPNLKAVVQEGLELLGYMILAYGACLSVIRGFEVPHRARM